MEFANVVWHPYLRKDIESIERVQMRATKLVPALRDLSYEARLKELKLPTLAHRRVRGDMIQTLNLLKDLTIVHWRISFLSPFITREAIHINWKNLDAH